MSSWYDIIPGIKILHEEFNIYLFVISDGWFNTLKWHVLGAIVTVQNKWFYYEEAIVNGYVTFYDGHNGLAVDQQMESAWIKTKYYFGISFGDTTTDKAVQCQQAQKIWDSAFRIYILVNATLIKWISSSKLFSMWFISNL